MKKTSLAVVFFGNERLATGVSTSAPTLRALIDSGYNVIAVVSNFEVGTSRKARNLEIQAVAEANNIPVLLPKSPIDIVQQLKDYRADVAVLAAYGKIIPQSVIDIFPNGIINIHPSLLPLHRGSTPIESVILQGAEKTGVSIMKLVKEMDAGPVYAQKEVQLTGKESKQELTDSLLKLGTKMIIDVLPKIMDGSANEKAQENDKATYDSLITKQQGELDWSKSAVQLEREIRAYAVWPQSHTNLAGVDVVITKAHSVPSDGNPGNIDIDKQHRIITVFCRRGYLCIDRLKPVGKTDMDVASFIAGYGERLTQ